MEGTVRQQFVISGVGGQGVLFITRLLAETAILKGISVFTSETHGMAQRGGTVISHVKVGQFSSPLIRPLQADGLLALKSNSLVQHGFYLKPDAWAVVNSPDNANPGFAGSVSSIDADGMARQISNPKSVNLIMLGFVLAQTAKQSETERLFCSLASIRTVLKNRLNGKKKMLADAILALEAGYAAGG